MKRYLTLPDVLTESAEQYADNTAFLIEDGRDGMRKISYKEFFDDTKALAAALKGKYALENKHIGIMAKNSYYWCVSYFAILSVGVAVPLDRESHGETVAELMNFGDITAVICDGVCARELKKSGVESLIISTETEEGFECLGSLIEYGRKRAVYTEKPGSGRAADEMGVLIFTSGTTGNPKGVMLSHNNILSDLEAIGQRIKITADDRCLSVLPLHHTYEAISILMIISRGGMVCFSSSYKNLIRDFSLYQPTVLVCVPLLLEKFDRKIKAEIGSQSKSKLISVVSGVVGEEGRRRMFAPIHRLFGGKLKKIIVGAAALDKRIAESFEAYGFAVIIGYGLTECSPIVICNGDVDRKPDSIGKPLEGVSIKIFDRDRDGVGEIAVKGPMVMKGYYKNKGATDGVIRDGWLYTGDLGYVDDEGCYYITGRCKNIIVTPGGKNIYPEEIESQILKSPLVSECVVSPGKNGEVIAEIFPDEEELRRKSRKDSISEKEAEIYIGAVIKTVNRRLIPYKRIRSFTLRETPFQKTSTHKIKRKKSD